jgi:hypothetical protein
MKKMLKLVLNLSLLLIGSPLMAQSAFTDAANYGFSVDATGTENTQALQKAVDQQGTIIVSKPGTYKIAGTVYLGSYTTLRFGNDVVLQKVDEQGLFTHVFLNKGALNKTYDENIVIEGLQISVNGIDKVFNEIYGLRGQIAFFYIKDLKIERFRMMDLESKQFGIHVCTFEDILIEDVIIKGKKDGIHLGRGRQFAIRDCVFQTFDDAIALNAHDYATSNPELGWIEQGVIENCHDLNADNTTGFFCRILGGGWSDWQPGMTVQHSDAVVANGRVYRVQAEPDGTHYKSNTKPSHLKGNQMLDGINWGMVQQDTIYTAGVRNVVFRDIFLEKPRTSFSIHFDNNRYSRSYYPDSPIPVQHGLLFDNVRILYKEKKDFLSVNTPIDVVTITNSWFGNNRIKFHANGAMSDYQKSILNLVGCVFAGEGSYELLSSSVENKEISLKTSASVELHENFSASINSVSRIDVMSDLKGLQK